MEIYFDDNGNQIPREPKTVSWINDYIKLLLEEEILLQDILVVGEISNYKKHSTGHLYFTLKDSKSEIRAVMFKSYASRVRFNIENGMRVIIHARIGVFPQSGAYQLYVDSIQPDGVGDLHLAYEQLKEKLFKEGLFDDEHKKTIPKFPACIGVITSPTGAAVKDIINIYSRRYPIAKLILYPSLVQGENAPSELIRGIEYFNVTESVDVIIIGRGGGSIEDLWAFNDESLARVIYNSKIPVISAVGHEIDFTICDFVADLRAPTPSAAAELATPNLTEIASKISEYNNRFLQAIAANVENSRNKLEKLSSSRVFLNPEMLFDTHKLQLDSIQNELNSRFDNIILKFRSSFAEKVAKLNALNPMSVLARGFSVVYDQNNEVIKSVEQTDINKEITIKFIDGNANAVVISKKEEKKNG